MPQGQGPSSNEHSQQARAHAYAACCAIRALDTATRATGWRWDRITRPSWADLAAAHDQLAQLLQHRPAADDRPQHT